MAKVGKMNTYLAEEVAFLSSTAIHFSRNVHFQPIFIKSIFSTTNNSKVVCPEKVSTTRDPRIKTFVCENSKINNHVDNLPSQYRNSYIDLALI